MCCGSVQFFSSGCVYTEFYMSQPVTFEKTHKIRQNICHVARSIEKQYNTRISTNQPIYTRAIPVLQAYTLSLLQEAQQRASRAYGCNGLRRQVCTWRRRVGTRQTASKRVMSRQGHLFHHSGIEHVTVKQMTCGTPAVDIVVHVT
jgi:hypothetical protein